MTINIGIPQLIIAICILINLGINTFKHGEMKEYEEYDFRNSLIYSTITVGLLWWGGFWN